MKTKTDTGTTHETAQPSAGFQEKPIDKGCASAALEFPDDCDGLGYHVDRDAKLLLGYVEEVNGAGAALAKEFTPTRFELEVIAEYWLTRLLDNKAFYFVYGQTGSTEIRENAFAERRLEKIRDLLGEQKYGRVAARVEATMIACHGDDNWREFRRSQRD